MFTNTIDLHIHTTASDGASSPAQFIDEAREAGLKAISLTDHESIEGFLDTDEACLHGIKLIPGIEFVTAYRNREIHLLGYLFDVNCSGFASRIKELRRERNEIYLEIVDNFIKQGFKIPRTDFIDIADKEISLGKNHIIIALARNGYIKNWEQVVDILRRYLTPTGLAYVAFDKNPFFEAVELIREANGVPVLAHPGLIGDDNLVEELLAGMQVGIEVYYHYFGNKRETLVNRYAALAEQKGLIRTGGSDYHGRYSPDVKLGRVSVPEMLLEDLVEQKARMQISD